MIWPLDMSPKLGRPAIKERAEGDETRFGGVRDLSGVRSLSVIRTFGSTRGVD